MVQIKIPSDIKEVDKIRSFLMDNLKKLNISDIDYYKIELSLLEICLNIIQYAYPEEKGYIFLKSWQQEGRIYFEIRDSGLPFDPRSVKEFDIDESIKAEMAGGIGIFLSRKFMDGFDYKREDNQNVLSMYKKLEKA